MIRDSLFRYVFFVLGVYIFSLSVSFVCKNIDEKITNADIELVSIKAGTFLMGCDEGKDERCKEWNMPRHSVTVFDFKIGKYEVTQAQWEAIMGENPSFYKKCPNCPVESITWEKVQIFLEKLNKLTGKKYRLPTETEWEFAARGGAKSKGYKYSGSNNPDKVGWFAKGEGVDRFTSPVGQKKPNELGIYDMSGNVSEMCSDQSLPYDSTLLSQYKFRCGEDDRNIRGGHCGDFAEYCYVYSRGCLDIHFRSNFIGFRLAHDVEYPPRSGN